MQRTRNIHYVLCAPLMRSEAILALCSSMAKCLIDIYTDELRFLIPLKQSVGILNNRIPDELSLDCEREVCGILPEVTL